LSSAVVLVGIALRAGIWWHDSAANPPRNWYVEDLYYPTWCRLDGLLAGVLLAVVATFRAQVWGKWLARGNTFLLAGLAGMALALWLFRDRVGLVGNTIGWPVLSAAIACLVVAANSTRSIIGRWRVPGAGWIAAISYSLYLSHKLVFHAVQQYLSEPLQEHGVLTFACYGAATLLGGAALYYLVERPFLTLREPKLRAPARAGALANT
jgi:peptidoglycan/LPS O-acetylase OafA/YrhL